VESDDLFLQRFAFESLPHNLDERFQLTDEAVTKGALYVCMASAEQHSLQRSFVKAGGRFSTFIVWAKVHFIFDRSDYQRQYEPILYGWKDGAERNWCSARDQGDVWFVDRTVANDLHPTMKPVELIERAVHNSSKSRDTIPDPLLVPAAPSLPARLPAARNG
jgi:DNA modification methylase